MIHVAIDLSGSTAYLGIRSSDGVVRTAERPMRGREAAVLADWVVSTLRMQGIEVTDVTHWTVGSGPGSFTGMRQAAALVAGLTARRAAVRTRCVPTALAWAAGQGEPVQVVYDGRNSEVLVYEVPGGLEAVLDRGAAPAWLAAHPARRIANAAECPAIAEILPGVEIAAVSGLDITALLDAAWPWDDDLTRLVYIRPAVHS